VRHHHLKADVPSTLAHDRQVTQDYYTKTTSLHSFRVLCQCLTQLSLINVYTASFVTADEGGRDQHASSLFLLVHISMVSLRKDKAIVAHDSNPHSPFRSVLQPSTISPPIILDHNCISHTSFLPTSLASSPSHRPDRQNLDPARIQRHHMCHRISKDAAPQLVLSTRHCHNSLI